MIHIREIIALTMLAISAYTDIREKHIYLMPMLVSVVSAVGISIVMIICATQDEVIRELYKWILMPLLLGAFSVIVSYFVKDIIGVGDIYLFSALAFLIGAFEDIRLICFSCGICGMYGLIKILFHKGNNSENLPFAPFVFIAFIGELIFEIV